MKPISHALDVRWEGLRHIVLYHNGQSLGCWCVRGVADAIEAARNEYVDAFGAKEGELSGTFAWRVWDGHHDLNESYKEEKKEEAASASSAGEQADL